MPHSVMERSNSYLERLVRLIDEREVSEVVIGLPKSLTGGEGKSAEMAKSLAADLEQRVRVPVRLFDERFTTVAAERALRESEVGGRRRRKVVDKVAATLLLQSYLDSKAS